jgi:NitT/TauT family transport system substrate-binding protein
MRIFSLFSSSPVPLRIGLLIALTIFTTGRGSQAAAVPEFVVGWSVYAGFAPYPYLERNGILTKWANKYGIRVKLRRFDYAASVEAFAAKNLDACAMANMEALDMAAAGGVDTTVLYAGDYSNGNDVILVRRGSTLKDVPKSKILLVEKTVSEYFLERALAIQGLERPAHGHLRLINTSDSDIAGAFLSDASIPTVVTWKPMASQLAATKGIQAVFDSSQIPGEIVDLMAVRTEVLNRPDGSGQKFAKALTGAWYEALELMSGNSPKRDQALSEMAAATGDSVASLKEQLSTTYMFYTAKSEIEFITAPSTKAKMNLVRDFCFRRGLLAVAKSADEIGVQYADGTVAGRSDRVRLRFDKEYVELAARGAL